MAATSLSVAGSMMVSFAKRDTAASTSTRTSTRGWGLPPDAAGLFRLLPSEALDATDGVHFDNFGPRGQQLQCPNATRNHSGEVAPTQEGYGYAMCFVSTAGYALFQVLYKRYACKDDDLFPIVCTPHPLPPPPPCPCTSNSYCRYNKDDGKRHTYTVRIGWGVLLVTSYTEGKLPAIPGVDRDMHPGVHLALPCV